MLNDGNITNSQQEVTEFHCSKRKLFAVYLTLVLTMESRDVKVHKMFRNMCVLDVG